MDIAEMLISLAPTFFFIYSQSDSVSSKFHGLKIDAHKIDRTLIAAHQWQTHDIEIEIRGKKYNSKKYNNFKVIIKMNITSSKEKSYIEHRNKKKIVTGRAYVV